MRPTLSASLRSLAPLLMCLVALAGAPLQAQEDPRAFAGALLGQGGKAYEAG